MSDSDENSDNLKRLAAGVDSLTTSLDETSDRVRKALKLDLAECGLSREEVAARLSARQCRISVALIEAYVAPSHRNRFPAELIPAWAEVTKSRRILELLAGEIGLSIATEEDRDFAALGRAHLKAQKLMTKLSEKI